MAKTTAIIPRTRSEPLPEPVDVPSEEESKEMSEPESETGQLKARNILKVHWDV